MSKIIRAAYPQCIQPRVHCQGYLVRTAHPNPNHRLGAGIGGPCRWRIWRCCQRIGARRSGVTAYQDRATGAGNRFFITSAHQAGIVLRRRMIDRTHALSISRQAALLGISRGAECYLPKPTSERDLAMMAAIDKLHLDFPFKATR
jgi:hypothetical protein